MREVPRFVVGENGLILTNYHVLGTSDEQVRQSTYYVTTAERQTFLATIKAADPWSDLAVLQIDARGLSPIRFGSAKDLKKGQIV